jgi:RNA-dependent RNA polymerase
LEIFLKKKIFLKILQEKELFITDVNICNVIPLEDEKRGKYLITDGIGKISKDLIEHSSKIWGINELNLNIISAIQIRFMGCKGVFALDPSLGPNTVHYRESQKKFESDDTALNICSVSNYKEGFLNRQFIILLSTLGVDDKIFEDIQDNITKKYIN